MTRRRWIADEVYGNRAALTGAHAAHLARVLRARIGQQFEISSQGRVRLGRVSSVSEDRVEFELGEELAQAEARPLTVLLSIFKFDRMEWAIEKLTELGVSTIVPIRARRSDSYLVAAAPKRVQRWQRIALQAAQQSRRAAPPEISSPRSLADVLPQEFPFGIVLAETEHERTLRQILETGFRQTAGELALAFGPEGGWTEEELAEFEQHGWQSASLGPGILRAETAAIAAVAICRAFSELPAKK
jgi:16S rRNA (uracil1498-N3)-methyltransferase